MGIRCSCVSRSIVLGYGFRVHEVHVEDAGFKVKRMIEQHVTLNP